LLGSQRPADDSADYVPKCWQANCNDNHCAEMQAVLALSPTIRSALAHVDARMGKGVRCERRPLRHRS
jgi:hypothetical protein